ncbi:MAG: hypothetical protein ABGZ53_26510 [Fuerstiella sp.]|nr:hypothetical protein [Fuerstiella sp.]
MLQGNADESLACYDECLTRPAAVDKDFPGAWQAVYDLYRVHEDLGEFHYQRGEQEKARDHYSQSAAQGRRLMGIYEGRALFLEGSWIIEWVIVSPFGRRPLGWLGGTIRSEGEGNHILQFLSVAHAKLAVASLDDSNPNQTEHHAQKSADYAEKLLDEYSDFPHVTESLKRRFNKLTYVVQRLQQDARTREWLQKILPERR